MGQENADKDAYLGWFQSGPNTFWAEFGLSMGDENADKVMYFERGSSGVMLDEKGSRDGKRTEEEEAC